MKFPKLKGKAILSPMSGVTDIAFRTLAKRYGAGLTCTEFVNSVGIVRSNRVTLSMLRTDPAEKPVAVQLFGSSFESVAEAAKAVEKKFDIIDINCGCPVWKVIKTGAGSEMLRKPDGIAELVGGIVDSVKKPVTIKIRSGIDSRNINAVEVARIAEEAGAAAITIHGRTQKQGYSGKADWEIIKKVKEAVEIPVVGNGDVFTPETFKKRLDESGVDYIMIARAAVGNPHIFSEINEYLKKGTYRKKEKAEQFSEYLVLAEKYEIGFGVIKGRALSFTKTLRNGAKLREKLSKCNTTEEINEVLGHYAREMKSQ